MGWTKLSKKQGATSDPAGEIATTSRSAPTMDEPGPPNSTAPSINSVSSQILHAFATPTLGHDSPLYYSSFDGGTRSIASAAVRDVKCDALATWLHQKAEEKVWTSGHPGEGVFVKKTKGNYAVSPAGVATDGTSLHQAITIMNVGVRCVHRFPLAADTDSP
jgi:hypothetical protein